MLCLNGIAGFYPTVGSSSQVGDTGVADGYQEASRAQGTIPCGAHDEYVTVLWHLRQT